MPETLIVKLLSQDSSSLHLCCHMGHCWVQGFEHTVKKQKDSFVEEGSCCWKIFQLTSRSSCSDEKPRLACTFTAGGVGCRGDRLHSNIYSPIKLWFKKTFWSQHSPQARFLNIRHCSAHQASEN